MTQNKFITFLVGNFLSYCVIAFILGGDAINGYMSDGRYFLKMSGSITEVSLLTNRYSLLHSLFTMGTPIWFGTYKFFKAYW